MSAADVGQSELKGATGDEIAGGGAAPKAGPTPTLERQLKGDLLCARCRYNLRGLTVRGACPECGLPIRATLRAVIDPHASELQPIPYPGVVAAGLIVWASGALLAALSVWVLRGAELNAAGLPWWVFRLPAIFMAISGLGAIVLIHPHGEIAGRNRLAAFLGVLCMGVMAALTWRIHAGLDAVYASHYSAEMVNPARCWLRLAWAACAGGAIAGLRPNARLFVARSLLLRSGRVDRQTLLVLVVVVLVGAVGDALLLLSTQCPSNIAEMVRLIGTVIILVSGLLLTLGLVGVLIDSLRLRHAVLYPPLSLSAVVGDDR